MEVVLEEFPLALDKGWGKVKCGYFWARQGVPKEVFAPPDQGWATVQKAHVYTSCGSWGSAALAILSQIIAEIATEKLIQSSSIHSGMRAGLLADPQLSAYLLHLSFSSLLLPPAIIFQNISEFSFFCQGVLKLSCSSSFVLDLIT